ncbi:hypothetical protein PHYNN_219 [Pantoea phage Phynn]|nr:hypothetical protein PHYNN_219 [Pantoea phage Phynn]
MSANMYNKIIDENFLNQMHQGMQGKINDIGGIMVLKTGLDFGRGTGKTQAIAEKIICDSKVGIYTYYFVKNYQSSLDILDRIRDRKVRCTISECNPRFIEVSRGMVQPYQAVNVIFDECDLTSSERFEYVRSVATQMQRADRTHPFPYIHEIRMGE